MEVFENDTWQEFDIPSLDKKNLDKLLEDGWRHFGTHFFRYKIGFHEEKPCSIIPLRISLEGFSFRKSQRKILKQNQNIKFIVRDAFIDEQKLALFEIHKQRFTENQPTSIFDFLASQPANVPTHTKEICLFDDDRMYAVSFIDIAKDSISSIYAMFDTQYAHLSPGNHTLFVEIEYALQQKMKYVYLGYAYREASFYDYKKRFNNLEAYNWKNEWLPFSK
jgi:leucyl-tRNA---protein transferase